MTVNELPRNLFHVCCHLQWQSKCESGALPSKPVCSACIVQMGPRWPKDLESAK